MLLVNSNIDYLNGFYYTFTLVAFAIGFDQIDVILGDTKASICSFVKACCGLYSVLVVMELDPNLYIYLPITICISGVFSYLYILK